MIAGHWSLFKYSILSYRTVRCINILYYLIERKNNNNDKKKKSFLLFFVFRGLKKKIEKYHSNLWDQFVLYQPKLEIREMMASSETLVEQKRLRNSFNLLLFLRSRPQCFGLALVVSTCTVRGRITLKLGRHSGVRSLLFRKKCDQILFYSRCLYCCKRLY